MAPNLRNSMEGRPLVTKGQMRNEWNFPKSVVNPHVYEDIKTYLGNEVLTLYESTDDSHKKQLIERVSDMLEYIGHLTTLSSYIVSLNKPHIEQRGNILIKYDNIEFQGHDYSGFEWDTEALVFYMYISLIDACIGQPEYIPPAKYVEKQYDENIHGHRDAIIGLLKQYSIDFGLSKNFRNAFLSLPTQMKTELNANVIVFKSNRKTSYDDSALSNYLETWYRKSMDDRIGIIADSLYDLRSKYTHMNIRNFIPNNVGNPEINAGTIICKKGFNLIDFLHNVIIKMLLR